MLKLLNNKYFGNNISPGLWALFGGKTLVLISNGFMGIFLPIFLYTLFDSNVQLVLFYFAVGYFLYALTVPWGVMAISRFGFRNALRLSVPVGAGFYATFYFIDIENMSYVIPISILLLLLVRTLYWTPYHVDFAAFTESGSRGRQTSMFLAMRNIMTGFIPILAGYLIMQYGFDVVFVIGVVIYLFSGLFYIKIPRVNECFSWTYGETWRKFFSKEKRGVILAFVADGAETAVGLIIWPIFIFELLDGNYFEVGAVSSLIIIVTVVVQFTLGKHLDAHSDTKKVLRWGSVLYAIGWIIKIFIITGFHIFVIGIYHNIMKIFTRTSFDTRTYEIAADQGHYVDEFTVLHQIAVNMGRTIMLVCASFVSYFLGIQWVFILAAISAVLLNTVHSKYPMERATDTSILH